MVEMLVHGLKSKAEVGGSIEELDLSWNSIKQEEWHTLIKEFNAKVRVSEGVPMYISSGYSCNIS